MELSVERNATLPRRWALSRFGLLLGRAPSGATAATWTRAAAGQGGQARPTRSSTLSGGNQQKVVLAKWLATAAAGAHRRRADPRHRRRHQGRGAPAAVRSWPRDGVAVLMVSSELPEVLGMADRVLVMHEGRLVADIPRARRRRGVGHVRRDRPGGRAA